MTLTNNCKLCGASNSVKIKSINSRPKVEIDYGINPVEYRREIFYCNNCHVYYNFHDNLLEEHFYSGKYNSSISSEGIKARFDKIINFSFDESDNKQRVLRVLTFLYKSNFVKENFKICDVGSGTCVFLYEMKKFNFHTSCIDPDFQSVEHARDIGIDEVFHGTIDDLTKKESFDLITFNKVLEHVDDPISILVKAKNHLRDSGIIYVELPCSNWTAKIGNFEERTEFNIEHNTIFNEDSFLFLSEKSGLKAEKIEIIIDPSGKHTIFGFLTHHYE